MLFIKNQVPQSEKIHLSIFYTRFSHTGSPGSWCLSPAAYKRESGSTVDQSPVYSRATQRDTGQTTRHPVTPKGNLKRPINLTAMFLDCGRKPEYPVRTHACTGRTCKLHAERPQTGPSCCKTTIPLTAPLCSPSEEIIYCKSFVC
ncbi:hypothetical protein GOODEAATRI_030992 [Goodea atripinnis]|uniref:Uncharacterized protein n=1 Tax=Goodea atripinnis TaxID=208336 RepID=A0ABV0N5N0_9TELE